MIPNNYHDVTGKSCHRSLPLSWALCCSWKVHTIMYMLVSVCIRCNNWVYVCMFFSGCWRGACWCQQTLFWIMFCCHHDVLGLCCCHEIDVVVMRFMLLSWGVCCRHEDYFVVISFMSLTWGLCWCHEDYVVVRRTTLTLIISGAI